MEEGETTIRPCEQRMEGKHAQVKEYYVDATTAMAYQFIEVTFDVPPFICS